MRGCSAGAARRSPKQTSTPSSSDDERPLSGFPRRRPQEPCSSCDRRKGILCVWFPSTFPCCPPQRGPRARCFSGCNRAIDNGRGRERSGTVSGREPAPPPCGYRRGLGADATSSSGMRPRSSFRCGRFPLLRQVNGIGASALPALEELNRRQAGAEPGQLAHELHANSAIETELGSYFALHVA
jgi:hypothetical protein